MITHCATYAYQYGAEPEFTPETRCGISLDAEGATQVAWDPALVTCMECKR